MSRPLRHHLRSRTALVLCTATALAAVGGVPCVVPRTSVVDAAASAWTTPTEPPECTEAQTTSGNVAGCVITTDLDMPELLGWPTAPFPTPTDVQVLPWVDLGVGASGTVVRKVQQALIERGATIAADGAFGPVTEAAVKAHQTTAGLPATGIVDRATATSLGVENTSAGTFPPAGWSWLGWGYNSSPALAAWERGFVSNPSAIGSLRTGAVRSFPEVLPLWEGFLTEIQARGYQIRNGGTYVFRCTAVTRKDCFGLTPASLSNHSYGLAADLNTAENPLKTYYGVSGRSACATPMLTDMPQWVVQVAEKWGLYWGGYGWTSGCSSPAQWRNSVTRDPMHFEFNGTPAQAEAILRYNLSSGTCVDRVDTTGTITNWCLMRGETPAAGTRLVVDTPAPAGATAALVNIATTAPLANGYITAEACGPRADGVRDWSNGNVRVGKTASATAIVPLDAQGRFCLYQSSAFHTIVDLQGWFVPAAAAPNGNLFTPVSPIRTVDTRTQTFCAADSTCFPAGQVPAETELLSTAPSTLSPVATLANITVANPSMPGYLTADSCAGLTPGPQSRSSLNFSVGDAAVTNLAVVPTASTEMGAQFCTYSPRQVHETIDVNGFFAPASQGGMGFAATTPSRVLDTRACWTDPVGGAQRCNQVNAAGSTVRLKAPAGVGAVVLNLAAVGATTNGTVTPAACNVFTANGATSPAVQASAGGSTANIAVVPVGPDGLVCVKVSSAMHLVVDLVGSFSAAADGRFVPVSPQRLLDTRPAG